MVVTGGGSGIGAATAAEFGRYGAEVAALDVDKDRAAATADRIGGTAVALACDVTDRDAVGATFDRVCERFGGVYIVVSNAGAAWQGKIGEVSDEVLRQSFELNFFAHQTVAQNAVRVMRAQGTGGVLLFNASKQAVNPGPDFGPYGLPKTATFALAKQYALDYGELGQAIFNVRHGESRVGHSGLGRRDILRCRRQQRSERLLGVDERLSGHGELHVRRRHVMWRRLQDVCQGFLGVSKRHHRVRHLRFCPRHVEPAIRAPGLHKRLLGRL